MTTTIDVDVVIVGGGPAGTAAALTLLAYSDLRVAVVERSDYNQVRIGETVPPSLKPLLEYLGVWPSFVADEHLAGYGMSAAWGGSNVTSRDFLFTGRGHGWHLDRRRFDRTLANEVAARNGLLFTSAQLMACAYDPVEGWRFKLAQPDDQCFELTATLVIDASGKQAVIARRFGARRHVFDRLVGVIGFYDVAGADRSSHFSLIETCADGWWYSAVLPDGRMVAAYMSDVDIVQQQQLHRFEGWQAKLGQSEHTRERIAGGHILLPLYVRPAPSQILQSTVGTGWIAAGDAAATFDPLASMGIGHAVSSGIHAARVVYDVLASEGSLVEQYTVNVARNFQNYLQLRRQYYLLEQRWSQQAFWLRRHQAPSPTASR